MAQSPLDIWNMALGFIGARTVADAAEYTPEAVQCSLYWDIARRKALRDYPWAFAQRRVNLAARALPEAWEGAWARAYGLPSDCLKAHAVTRHGSRSHEPFALAVDVGSGGGCIVLTDVDRAVLAYTGDVSNVSCYDEDFVMALSRRLACLVAVPLLKHNPAKMQELEQLYRAALPAAHENDATARKDRPEEDDAWVRTRWGAQ